jgi:hypothetical protein
MRALRALHREIWGQAAYDAAYGAGAPRSSSQGARVGGFGAIGLGVLFVLFGIAPSAANATQPNPEHKVTLCHATDSYSNPYVRITVDVAAVLHHGHDGHNGPVFYPAIPKHTKWGDIIPPFDFGPHEQYAGKNWTPVGITVFDNGCAATSPSTTSTAPKTTSSSAVTTTTSTIPVGTSTSSTSPPTTVGGSTTTTTPSPSTVPDTTSTSAVTSTTVSTVTTAGGADTTTTEPGATSTTISGTVVTLGNPSTTIAATDDNPLPFTGGNSGAAIVAGLVLIAAGFGLTRRMPRQP